MSAAAVALLVYSAQMLLVIAVAGAMAAAVRLTHPAARLVYWRMVGALCLALPLLASWRTPPSVASVTFSAAATQALSIVPDVTNWWNLSNALLWVIAAGILVRLAWLFLGAWHLRSLRASSTPLEDDADIEALRARLAPRAHVRGTARLSQPVAFGVTRPLVLLPRTFVGLSPTAQRAVACHEFIHVARRDWLWLVAEEHVRALFWFHPGVWWVLDQIHLSREQVVDACVVTHIGSRKAYMEALLQFADEIPARTPALAFLRRRHVAARLRHLSKETPMSRLRLASAACVLLLVLTAATGTVVSALPLDLAGIVQGIGASPRLEIRLAEREPSPGLTAAPGTGPLYLHAEVLAGTADVVRARAVEAHGGRYAVDTIFSTAAAARLAAATGTHVGRPLAVLLNGRVIATPTVRSAIGGNAILSGAFTQAQAETIARGLSASAPAPPAPQEPHTTGEPGVTPPTAVTSVRPRYPQSAKEAKITGDVRVGAVVQVDGSVDEAHVTQSLDTVYGLDESAVDATKQWRFTPGTKDGRPVPVRIELLFTFKLK